MTSQTTNNVVAIGGRPRIEPGTRQQTGVFAWGFAHVSGLVTRTAPPNLFLTMGRQPKLFRGWLRFAGRLMPGGTLPRPMPSESKRPEARPGRTAVVA